MSQSILENDRVRICVSSRGAELQSLYSKDTDLEYLWQPGTETWPHHSMLLFPNAGRIARDRVIIEGKVYPAMMHGFVNDMEFEQVSCKTVHGQADREGKELWFAVKDTAYTQRYFPYRFRLQVGFVLDEDKVIQHFRVINDDEKAMYFSLGAHPGFYCPIDLRESADAYALYFDRPQNINLLHMEPYTRLLDGKESRYIKDSDEIRLGEHFFDQGPMLLGDVCADTVTLMSNESGYFMEMGITDFPYMCLWGVPGKMSLIAIEPWCGISDALDTDHVWETKRGIECVGVGEVFERTLTFRMGKNKKKHSNLNEINTKRSI